MKEVSRDQVLRKSFSVGLIMKIVSVGLSFLYIPLLLSYLTIGQYGLWITIMSIISWVYIFDLGMGNGLKIKLSEALADKNHTLAKKYISSTYVMVIVVAFVVYVLGVSLVNSPIVVLSSWFSGAEESEKELLMIVVVTFSFVMMNFIISLYKQVLYATNRFYFISVIDVLVQLTNIVLLLAVKSFLPASVIAVSILYGSGSVVLGLLVTFFIFKSSPTLMPSYKCFDFNICKDIFSLGSRFLIIQLTSIIIYSTDNLIISRFIGVDAVTAYSIVAKIFGGVIMIWYLLTGPITPLFVNAAVKKDVTWIYSTLKKMNVYFLYFCLLVFFLIIFGESLSAVWLQREINFPDCLYLFYGVFVLLRLYGDLYMSFLNAIKVMNVQILLSIFTASLNIPLSIYFVDKMGLGSSGAILATCISIAPMAVTMPFIAFGRVKNNRLGRLD